MYESHLRNERVPSLQRQYANTTAVTEMKAWNHGNNNENRTWDPNKWCGERGSNTPQFTPTQLLTQVSPCFHHQYSFNPPTVGHTSFGPHPMPITTFNSFGHHTWPLDWQYGPTLDNWPTSNCLQPNYQHNNYAQENFSSRSLISVDPQPSTILPSHTVVRPIAMSEGPCYGNKNLKETVNEINSTMSVTREIQDGRFELLESNFTSRNTSIQNQFQSREKLLVADQSATQSKNQESGVFSPLSNTSKPSFLSVSATPSRSIEQQCNSTPQAVLISEPPSLLSQSSAAAPAIPPQPGEPPPSQQSQAEHLPSTAPTCASLAPPAWVTHQPMSTLPHQPSPPQKITFGPSAGFDNYIGLGLLQGLQSSAQFPQHAHVSATSHHEPSAGKSLSKVGRSSSSLVVSPASSRDFWVLLMPFDPGIIRTLWDFKVLMRVKPLSQRLEIIVLHFLGLPIKNNTEIAARPMSYNKTTNSYYLPSSLRTSWILAKGVLIGCGSTHEQFYTIINKLNHVVNL